ncbi:MAG: hypothetical protein MUC87_15830 [Bacteroidia bacterium]|jgi:hypothetical protein|nr:hypothetical protein [Bacteroidia bacterium]
MRKLLFAAAAFALLQSCSGDTKTSVQDIVPAGQTALDLTPQGFPLKINIPDSTFGVAEVMEGAGGVGIKVGSKFEIVVNTAAPEDLDMKQQKALAQASMDGATVNFVTDSDTLLVWETKFFDLKPSRHFYMIKKIGEDNYIIRDNIQNAENQFEAAEIARMQQAAASLRAKPAAEAKK